MASVNATLSHPTKTAAITPSDTTDTTLTCQLGIWVGGAGNVAVQGIGDSAATTLVGVAAGTYIPGRYKRIMSTNTTATSIVGFSGGRGGP